MRNIHVEEQTAVITGLTLGVVRFRQPKYLVRLRKSWKVVSPKWRKLITFGLKWGKTSGSVTGKSDLHLTGTLSSHGCFWLSLGTERIGLGSEKDHSLVWNNCVALFYSVMRVKCFRFEMRHEQERLRWKSRCATRLLLIHQRGKLKTRLHKKEGSSETHLSTEAGDFTRPHQLCTAVFCCNITQCFILWMTYLDCCSNSRWLQMVLISSVRLICRISV